MSECKRCDALDELERLATDRGTAHTAMTKMYFDAEARIESLQAKVAALKAALEVCHVPVKRLTKENAALQDALAEAQEHDWITAPQDIPDYVVSEIESALAGSGYE